MSDTDKPLFTAADERATLEGRIRQLEGERYGNQLQYDETIADPNVDNEVAEAFEKNVASLDARLAVLRQRLGNVKG